MSEENILSKETPLSVVKPTLKAFDNHLLLLAVPLLGLIVGLKNTMPESNKEELSTTFLQIFSHFNQKAQQAGYSLRTILAAQYCLCTALDESIMNTPWGHEVKWGNDSLLTTLYKETFGGERFYIILESLLSSPQENIDILELLYVLISLGFKGKFYNKDPLFLEAVRMDLFKKIFPFLHTKTKDYLQEWTSQLDQKRKKLVLPLWVVGVLTLLILLMIMITYDYFLNRASLPIFNFLEELYSHSYQQEDFYEKTS